MEQMNTGVTPELEKEILSEKEREILIMEREKNRFTPEMLPTLLGFNVENYVFAFEKKHNATLNKSGASFIETMKTWNENILQQIEDEIQAEIYTKKHIIEKQYNDILRLIQSNTFELLDMWLHGNPNDLDWEKRFYEPTAPNESKILQQVMKNLKSLLIKISTIQFVYGLIQGIESANKSSTAENERHMKAIYLQDLRVLQLLAGRGYTQSVQAQILRWLCGYEHTENNARWLTKNVIKTNSKDAILEKVKDKIKEFAKKK